MASCGRRPAARSAVRWSRTSCSSSRARKSRTSASVRRRPTRSCRPPKMLAGDFTDVMSAACQGGVNRTLGAPFVGNKVNPALFNPIALKIAALVPSATTDACGRTKFTVPNDSDEIQTVVRSDYQVSPAQKVFGRYYIANYDRAPSYDGTNVLLATGTGLGLDNRVQTLALGHDWVLSPTLTAATRFSYQKSRIFRVQGQQLPTWTALGSNVYSYTQDPGQNFYNLSVTNGWATPAFPGKFVSTTPQISEDVDWVHGDHSLSFGGMWMRPFEDADGPFQANGTLLVQRHAHRRRDDVGPARHGGLPDRTPELVQPGRQPDRRREDELPRSVRPGCVARQQPGDDQRRPPVGTVPGGEGPERVHDGVQSGLVQSEPPQRGVSECARRPDVRRRRGIPDQRREHQQSIQPVRSPRRRGLGSDGRRLADAACGGGPLLRFAEALAVRPPHAQPAVRQHRGGHQPVVLESLGDLPRRKSVAGAEPGSVQHDVPDARNLREHAHRHPSDAGAPVERVVRAPDRERLAHRGHLSGKQHDAPVERLRAQSGCLHSRSVDHRERRRASRAEPAESGARQVLRLGRGDRRRRLRPLQRSAPVGSRSA